jgi:hypothetical protein
MPQPPEEWLRQADYDMDTADHMFGGGSISMPCSCVTSPLKKLLKGFTEKN